MEDGLIYFLHGFVLLNLGLMLTLEAGRSPALAPPPMLALIAAFAGLVGLHEWLEIFIRHGTGEGVDLPASLLWLHEISLAVGSAALITAGLHLFRPDGRLILRFDVWPGLSMLLFWGVVLFASGTMKSQDHAIWLQGMEMWSRYLLTAPGAILTAVAMQSYGLKTRREGHGAMGRSLCLAAAGFLLYGGSQLFFAMEITTSPLSGETGGAPWPGQLLPVLRMVLAGLIFVALFQAVFIGERERQQLLATAERGYRAAKEQLQQELLKRKEQRQKLMRHILIAQEDERARIARELHDETAQTITAAALNLAGLENLIPKNPEISKLVSRLQSLCHDMSRGLYRMVHDLRPAQLDDLGLVPALRHLVDESRRHSSIETTFTVEGAQHRLDPLVETVLFRIAQEALTNVAKHARTSEAEMRLRFEPHQVILQVNDRGVGFEPEQEQASQNGWGMAGMHERAEAVGGLLRLYSRPDEGSRVEVVVPLGET